MSRSESRSTIAITHHPSPRMQEGQRTYVDREAVVDMERARSQHERYRALLADCGAEVRVLDVNTNHPDAVFVEDTAVVLDEVAVMMSMGAASRRAEPAGIEPELRKYREIQRVQLPATIDGGDVFRVGGMLFVGRSERTNAAGIDRLTEIGRRYGYEVAGVRMHDCLHLKSGCTPLPDGRLLVNPAWIETSDLEGFRLVPVPAEEAFSADVLSIDQRVLMAAAFPRTAELVTSLGFEVRTLDLSEFAKVEGGVTCMSLVFSG
jgi:dimethylargininase